MDSGRLFVVPVATMPPSQEYSRLYKFYKVCGFQSFLQLGVSFPPGSHSSGVLCVRLNGSFMSGGTGESQTLSGTFLSSFSHRVCLTDFSHGVSSHT